MGSEMCIRDSFMIISSWRRNWAVRRRFGLLYLRSPHLWRDIIPVRPGRSGVLVTLPATRLWRPDSQSAPRHLVSRVSLCLPRGARTAIGAGGLGAVDSQFSSRYGRSRKSWACRTDKEGAGEAWGRACRCSGFKGVAAGSHLLRRAHGSTMRVWFQSIDDVQKSGFL